MSVLCMCELMYECVYVHVNMYVVCVYMCVVWIILLRGIYSQHILLYFFS